MRKRNSLAAVLLLLCMIVTACSKPAEKPTETPEETDWRDRYGITVSGTVTPEPAKPTKTPKPTGFDISSIELPYPTPLPVREFVPEEGQIELVLWMFGDHDRILDDHIVAELNYILQQRGYSFYLSKRIEPTEVKVAQVSLWQEALDSGEKIDLIFLGHEDNGVAYKQYGNTAVIRAIQGEYLLPFSEYPETEAKERLLSAYPEDYWRLCSFRGENYGVSNVVSRACQSKYYLMLNLDAAEQAGIEVPETLDILHLDELLKQAEEAGLPGMEAMNEMTYCGIRSLDSGLYVKYLQDGEYKIINPLEDEELLALWDAQYRYKEKGWGDNDSYATGEIPLVLYESGTYEDWEVDRFCMRSEEGEISARVKVYEETERAFVEGSYNEILGLSSSSRHKEEAVELLSLMHGDEEIVQLLRYGIEGVHYRFGEDGLEEITTSEIEMHEWGFSIPTKTWKTPGSAAFGDLFGNSLMYVELDERFGRPNMEEEWYAGMADIELIPYLEDFSEEQKEVQKKIRELTFLIGKGGLGMSISDISGSLITLKEDYKSQIEDMRVKFAEAGYNELAKEVNEAHGLE